MSTPDQQKDGERAKQIAALSLLGFYLDNAKHLSANLVGESRKLQEGVVASLEFAIGSVASVVGLEKDNEMLRAMLSRSLTTQGVSREEIEAAIELGILKPIDLTP